MGKSWLYRIPLILALFSGFAIADQCQITSPLPVPVTISGCTFSGSLPNNSTSYIQNSLSPTTTTQQFSVQDASTTNSETLGYLGGTQCLHEVNGSVLGTGSDCGSGGGGGGSGLPVAVTTGPPTTYSNPAISSPMLVSVLNQAQFGLTASGTTAYWNINPAMATIATSTSSLQTQITATGVSTGSLQGQINNVYAASTTFTNQITNLQQSFPVSLSTNTTGLLPVANGGTGTASPSLIAGTNITSITGSWPNQTINAATQSSGGGGGSPLAVTTGTVTTYSNPAISSPTAVIIYDQALFKVSLPGATTAFVTSISTITAASLGALTGNQTITLSGDSTGSGATAITVTAANSQPHITQFTQPITMTSSLTITSSLGENVTYNLTAGTITTPALQIQTSSVTVLGASGLTVNSLTASTPVQTDANDKLISAAIDLSGSQATGIMAAGREPAHTGDVTNSAGSLAMTAAAVQGNITEFTHAITLTSSLTVTGAGGISDPYGINAGTVTGAGLTTCGDSSHAVSYSATTGLFACQSITGSASAGGVTPNVQYNSGGSIAGTANFNIFTSSIVESTVGFFVSSTTVQTVTASTSAFVVNSTSSLAVFQVDNSTITAGDYLISISSVQGTSSSSIFTVDTYGNILTSGTIKTPFGINAATETLSSVLNVAGASTFASSLTVNGNFGVLGNVSAPMTFASSVTIAPGLVIGSPNNAITSTTTLTSTMTVVEVSPVANTAWVTLTLPSAASNPGLDLMIYKVDSSTIAVKIIGASTDLIEGTGTVRLDAPFQHASLHSLGSAGWGSGTGGIQYTPAWLGIQSEGSTNSSVAAASNTDVCPFYNAVPAKVTGFRYFVVTKQGNVSFAIYDTFGNLIVSTGPIAVASAGVANVLTNPVTLPPGQFYVGVQLGNQGASIGANSPSGGNGSIFCSQQTASSMVLPNPYTLPGTASLKEFNIKVLVAGGRTSL